MNIVDPAELYRAVAYTAGGGAMVKVLDILLKWHRGQRVDAISEATAALKIATETRAELRKEIEEMRRDKEASDARAEAAENELRSFKRHVSMEQRARRHSEDDDQTARRKHEDETP